jgi:membrane-bound inhibitor of C-type lysozyme
MGMARMLMPSGDRIDLYQIPSGSGVRFSNGNMELRGKGIELVLIDDTTGTQSVLTQCAPYSAPKK